MATTPSPRAAAALTLAQVIGAERSLTDALETTAQPTSLRDRALARELCYGVLRHGLLLQVVYRALVKRPPASDAPLLQSLLLCGLYQLIHLNTPPHAAVGATVAAAAELGLPWAKGFVNGVLRAFQRDAEGLLVRASRADPPAALGCPAWWLSALQAAYPQQWDTVVAAGNTRPPLVLRINRERIRRDDYLVRLNEAGIGASAHAVVAGAVVLDEPQSVETIPGFREGLCSVQDAAAQLAAPLLLADGGLRILDACAAPGGKTGHLLELLAAGGTVTALDKDASRRSRIDENLARLRLSAQVVTGDATLTDDWWDGRPFDRILLDAPCSATGIVRRHPDIKWLRRPADISKLADYQKRLLQALWPLLAPQGRLLYTTCSVLPEENEGVVQTFLAAHPDAREQVLAVDWGEARVIGRQVLPGQNGMDGFYYACLNKVSV